MIEEIKTIPRLEEIFREWNTDPLLDFWRNQTFSPHRKFNPDSIESNLRVLLSSSINKEDIIPYVKIWSYKENGNSIGGCVFLARENFMMKEKIFEEILWQVCGKFADTTKEKKILIKLLNHAENYARKSGLDSIVISRHPDLHKSFKTNSLSNYYTKNNYEACAIQYMKYLK